jgi:hypothetical protein
LMKARTSDPNRLNLEPDRLSFCVVYESAGKFPKHCSRGFASK